MCELLFMGYEIMIYDTTNFTIYVFYFYEKIILLHKSGKLVYNQIYKTKFWHSTKYIFATSIYKFFL